MTSINTIFTKLPVQNDLLFTSLKIFEYLCMSKLDKQDHTLKGITTKNLPYLCDNLWWTQITNHTEAPCYDRFGEGIILNFEEPKGSNESIPPKRDAKYDIVLLFSGGLDSYIGYYYATKILKKKCLCLWVDYGQPYREVEREAIKRLGIPVKEIDLSVLAKMVEQSKKNWGHVFPIRNWILAIIAWYYTKENGQIWMCSLEGEGGELNGDKSTFFFERGNQILNQYYGTKSIQLKSPFKEISKTELVKWYKDTRGDIKMLKNTTSCHEITSLYDQLPCGRCVGCSGRYVAMTLNGIEELYSENPKEWQLEKYVPGCYDMVRTKNQYLHYSDKRCREILDAILLNNPSKIPINTVSNMGGKLISNPV